jgi:hypothetical protein
MAIHDFIKNDIWQYLTNLSPKNKSLIQSRLGVDDSKLSKIINSNSNNSNRGSSKNSPSIGTSNKNSKYLSKLSFVLYFLFLER